MTLPRDEEARIEALKLAVQCWRGQSAEPGLVMSIAEQFYKYIRKGETKQCQ